LKPFQEELIGLIPAAGKGERLRLPFPKELYPVNWNGSYKPVSQFVLENLTSAGVRHIVFVVNATKHQLIDYFGDGHRFDCRISYVVQESRGLESASTSPGLAHSISSAYHLIQNKTVFFGMADTIMEPVNVFSRAYGDAGGGEDAVLGLFPSDEPQKFGAVRLDAGGSVVQIEDKQKNTQLTEIWGFIIWRPKFTEYLQRCVREGTSDFCEIMNSAITGEKMVFRGHRVEAGKYLDLGTYQDIDSLRPRREAPGR
jgi:glucose-1-phosphate thymidylyltransferase